MITIERATREDAEELTEIQTRTFEDDNKLKPPGCSMEGPPGYNSVSWNAEWIEKTPYYKILFDGQIVGGIVVFDMGQEHYEMGRIYVDPDFQSRGMGQQAVELMFRIFPKAEKWVLGTPSWAVRNQHSYEKMGFEKLERQRLTQAWVGLESNMRRTAPKVEVRVRRPNQC